MPRSNDGSPVERCRCTSMPAHYEHSPMQSHQQQEVTVNSTNRQSTYKFLLAFHRNCVPILHRFWDIARYWSKIATSKPSHFYLAPPLRVTPLEFRLHFWRQKTGVPGQSYGIVCVILGLAVLVQHWLMKDGQTDDDSIYHALRSKNKVGKDISWNRCILCFAISILLVNFIYQADWQQTRKE